MTVAAAVLESTATAANEPDLLNLVTDLATFRRQPTYWSGGRSGWQVLDDALAEKLDCVAIRLKGLGMAPEDGGASQPPSARMYDRWPGQPPDAHLGVAEDLELCLRYSTPSPEGGLRASAARTEFSAALQLGVNGVAAPRALLTLANPVAKPFHGEDLAVSVTGMPLRRDSRASALLHAPTDDFVLSEFDRMADALGSRGLNGDGSPRDRLTLLRACYRAFGGSLSEFSHAGWYRYSGHPGNILIDTHGRAVLIDLDSCRQFTADVSSPVFAMEAVRDGMSALYNLACSFFSMPSLALISDDELVRYEPFGGFIEGWTGIDVAGTLAHVGLDSRRIGETIAAYVIASRVKLRMFSPFLRSAEPAAAHLYRYVRHDRDLTFTWLYRVAYQLVCLRDGDQGMPLSLGELDDRLLRFAGRERFDRALHLCAECGLDST